MNREIIELREVISKLVPMLTGKGLVVTQRGSQAYVTTDPATKRPKAVNIPMISDNASPEFIRAIQGYIDHEVAHVLITNWHYYAGGPSAAELRSAKVQQFMSTHNIVEDTMIEREIVKIFPGSRKNIADLRRMFVKDISLPAILKSAADPKEQFAYICVPLMRALAGHEEFIEMMDDHKLWDNPFAQEVVEKLSDKAKKSLKTCSSTKETLEIAKELHAIMYPPASAVPPMKMEADDTDKPEEKAESGAGTGERDHEETDDSETDAGEPGDSEAGDTVGDDAGAGADDEDGDDESDGDEAGEDPDDEDEDDTDPGADEPDAPGDDGDFSEGDETDAGEDDAHDGSDDTDAPLGGDPADGEDDPDADDVGSKGAGGKSVDRDLEGDGTGDEIEGSGGEGVSKIEGEIAGLPDGATSSGDSAKSDHGLGSVSLFGSDPLEEDALDGKDMGSAIGEIITKEALLDIAHNSYTVFSRDWDKIEPLPVNSAEIKAEWVPDMEDQVRQMIGRMQKDIERMLASQSHVIRTPGHRRGKLHTPSLYRVPSGDDRVFSQKQEHHSKDTTVTLLVDNSGSMGGSKQRLAMLAAYALSLTLERVNISHEVMGFTTHSAGWSRLPATMQKALEEDYAKSAIDWNRTLPLYMPIYKGHDERINATVKQRFARSIYQQDYLSGNIDGECLEYAAMRMVKRREKRKVMLVLSDGAPLEARDAPEHLRFMVDQLTNKWGIDCIGIGILDDSVRKFYPKYTVLRKVEDLPGQVMQELKKILT